MFFEDVDNSKAEKANKGSSLPIHTQTTPPKNLIKEKTTSFEITFTVFIACPVLPCEEEESVSIVALR